MSRRSLLWIGVLALGTDRTAQPDPAIFLPGVVSTAAPEFAVTLTPDGNEVFFNRASANRDTLTIMVTRREGGRWSEPRVAPFSGAYRDVDPFVTPDGRRLYFSSNRPRPGESRASFDTWYVERRGAGWTEPSPLPAPFNTDSSETFVSVAVDGSIMFASNRDGSMRIYWAPNVAESSRPEPIDFGGFKGGGNPAIHPEGNLVVFVKEGPADRADLHWSCRRNNQWTTPVRLDAANSPQADFAPSWDHSGRILYFTSERPGIVKAMTDSTRPPGDIYSLAASSLPQFCP